MEQTFQSTEVLWSISAFVAAYGHAEVSTCPRMLSGALSLLGLQWQRGLNNTVSGGCGQPFQA